MQSEIHCFAQPQFSVKIRFILKIIASDNDHTYEVNATVIPKTAIKEETAQKIRLMFAIQVNSS